MGSDDTQARNEPTWPATQVCPRRVGAGLGSHEEGVIGVDEGVESASLPLWKRGRNAMSECPTFSGFIGLRKILSVRDKPERMT